jgi:protein-S-isoprenylcysteine O-methyltransferase Ste14
MAFNEEFEKTGNWLFRWRSYLPLSMIGVVLWEMRNFNYPYESHRLDELWEILCLTISFCGLGIRVFTTGYAPRGTSGRNTRRHVADALNVTGMYSIVRHPLYLGNFLIWLGISLFVRSWGVSLIFILGFWLYYERIIFAEEQFLRRKFGDVYSEWAARTPAFLPRFKNWRSPRISFSVRKAFRKEYHTFFAVIFSFTILEIGGDLFAVRKIELDLMWLIIFSIGLTIYLILRILGKKTKILDSQ